MRPIVEYIIVKHGGGRLAPGPQHPDFAHWLYGFHFANGNLQPNMARNLVLNRLALPADNPILVAARGRLVRALDLLEHRLCEVPYLAGADFTAADIMTIFSLTTMRLLLPFDLAPYVRTKANLRRMGDREAYQRAMLKGEPDLVPMLT